jgi:acetolactate decarboxylase
VKVPLVSADIPEPLSTYLGVPVHALFRISTSGAHVAGVYDGQVSVKSILEHGNFGLGTFANLDAEMVVLEGQAFQVLGAGQVLEASPDAGVPFAVMTRFSPQVYVNCRPLANFKDLEQCCDRYRLSGNILYAIRLDGHFDRIRTRAVGFPAQNEFSFTDIDGTLVGFWSPGLSSVFGVPGYQFYFISKDRKRGGLLLDVEAVRLSLRIESLTDFHIALSASETFLTADLVPPNEG